MKILVLSDSHASLSFMRLCIRSVNPQVVIHLGDHYDDAQDMEEEFRDIRFYYVPGNCDYYRAPQNAELTLVPEIGGVRIYMTHGHLHRVKSGPRELLSAARQRHTQAVLFGHTHSALCYQEEDGLWVLNPGSCGYYGGSAGLLEIEKGKVQSCRILRQENLEEFL